MPKPTSTDLNFILSQFAYMKTPSFDVLHDFYYILTYQKHRFKEDLPDELLNKLEQKISFSKKHKQKPQFSNRIYLITDLDVPELVMFDVQQCIFDNLESTCSIIGELDPWATPPAYCNTLFLFKNDEAPYHIDIATKTFAELIRCFSKDNLLSDAKVRDSWYGEPRRSEKKNGRS